MNRRIALRHLALISGGLALIPSCDFSSEDILAAYEKLKITASQKSLLGDISNTIIPAGEIKGALDLEVPDFILVMINDCFTTENQILFTQGLAAFPAYVKNSAGSSFDKLETKKKEEVIQAGTKLESGETEEGKERPVDKSLTTQTIPFGFSPPFLLQQLMHGGVAS
jgi:hypothetical protein